MAALDVQYLEALFAEMDLPHDGIRFDDQFTHLCMARVRGGLQRRVIEERLNRLGFHDVTVASNPRDGAYAVRFRVVPKGAT